MSATGSTSGATSSWIDEPSGLGVVVSGGAPTLHLAAGALCAFYEKEVSFDVVATSGAGALPGLLYMAPKHRDPVTALKRIVNLNIYDAIHRLVPNNFKVFFKYGPFSPLFWQLGRMIPHFELRPEARLLDAPQRLYNDLVDVALAALTPTTLTYWSKSVLNRVQVINDLVDWDALKRHPKHFFLNTFNLARQELELFDKSTMSPERFYAALAMPWLYPPTEVAGAPYTEGASHDPSGLEALKASHDALEDTRALDAIVVLETIGPELWTDPEDLHEALALTIMDPIVTLAENIAALTALQDHIVNEGGSATTPTTPGTSTTASKRTMPKVYRLRFDLSSWERGKTLEWSYSNAVRLWDVGYHAAEAFHMDAAAAAAAEVVAAPTDAAPGTGAPGTPPVSRPRRRSPRPADQYRYLRTIGLGSRVDDFLRLFGAGVANPLASKLPRKPLGGGR